MNKLIAIVCLLITAPVLAQERQLLKGKIIADEFKVENHTIENVTAGTSNVSDAFGNFRIHARPGDQLNFISAEFKPLTVVLAEKDFKEELFVVRVEPHITFLKEMVLHGLTGSLAAESKKLETMQINSLFDAAEINKDIMVQTGIGGANWITGVTQLFKKPKKPKRATEYVQPLKTQRRFSEIVKESYPEKFFTETLAVPLAHVGAFLVFCDDRAERRLLEQQHELELVEFLKAQSVEFLKRNPDAK